MCDSIDQKGIIQQFLLSFKHSPLFQFSFLQRELLPTVDRVWQSAAVGNSFFLHEAHLCQYWLYNSLLKES